MGSISVFSLGVAWAVGFLLRINRFQIAPEERVLSAMFDTGYSTCRSRVRRWPWGITRRRAWWVLWLRGLGKCRKWIWENSQSRENQTPDCSAPLGHPGFGVRL